VPQERTITSPEEAAQMFREKVQGIWLAQLITRSSRGGLRGRPVATQQVEFGSDLWFFTDDRSEKVQDIGASPEVHLAYFPEGWRDPHLVLIKVTPTQGEYWQGPDRNAIGEEAARQTQAVKLTFAARRGLALR
jgi:general stress protein 26